MAQGMLTGPVHMANETATARARHARRGLTPRQQRIVVPFVIALFVVAAWEAYVRIDEVPAYILPSPSLIATTLVSDWPLLFGSLLVTLKITFIALFSAAVGGSALAILFVQSKWIENSFFPYAVVLQVTPIIAIAPVLLVYIKDTQVTLLICAWIVAFFPILSNTTLGLHSIDRGLADLFRLYGAGRARTLWSLRIPSAMPYFLGGLKIAGGLSLIGAVVAEFTAGAAGSGTGLAYRILESSYRLNIPRMFAALLLVSATGILIYIVLSVVSHLMLRNWHESAIPEEE